MSILLASAGIFSALATPGGPPDPGPQPAFGAAAINHAAGVAACVVTFPSGIAAGHHLFLGILSHIELEETVLTVPAGFVAYTGWSVVTSTGTDLNPVRLRGYWKKATGAESGTSSVTFAGNGTYSTLCARFTNVNPDLSPPIEQFGSGSGQGSPLTMPTLTTSINNRLGVAFVGFGNDETIGAFSGGSGSAWTLRAGAFNNSGNDRSLALLTCDLSTAGTSSGHQYAGALANNEWAIAKFALLPNPTGA